MTDQFIGQVLADKYQIDSLISEDNLGNYYHATHLLMEKPVAVKILSPALAVDETIVKRFAAEARTVSRISHPNILNVTDYGSDKNGTVFIVYEDAAGETLKDVIERAGKFPLERANHVVKQIASALSIAHANGIVHRNLMSDNILIKRTPSDAEEVKIFNFHIDSESDADNPESLLSERAKYTSPEMISTPSEVDERTDVYSLGVILYEMMAGEVPFNGDKPTDILLKHAEQMPPPIAAFRYDLPDQIGEVLMTALAKKPDLRYQTVNNLADSLNRISVFSQEKSAAAAVALKGNTVAEAVPNNNLWKTAFIVLAGICLMSGFFFYMTSGKVTNPSTQLQTDANGIPVQPLNPSTGSSEQTYANMNTYDPGLYGNSNSNMVTQGDSNPYWDAGRTPPGAPPPGTYGTPYPVYPGGSNTVYMESNGTSIFMQDGNSYIMVPKNANTAVNTPANSKKPNANVSTNTQTVPSNTTVKPSPTPAASNTAPSTTVKPTPTPAKPKATPSAQPKNKTVPSATDKSSVSGKELDGDKF